MRQINEMIAKEIILIIRGRKCCIKQNISKRYV